MKRIFRTFFPSRNPIRRIPLRTKIYAGANNIYGLPPDEIRADLRLVAGRLGISQVDAWLLLNRHPDLSPDQIVRKYKRTRRRGGIWQRFKRRFRLWWVGYVLLVVLLVGAAAPALAQESPEPLATVTAAALNVRSGPGTGHEVIGQLRRGNRLRLSGRSEDGLWLYFFYWERPAWISAQFVRVAGDVADLPIVQLAPGKGEASIRLEGAAIDPAVPRPGQAFRVLLTLRNVGTADSGPFSVATAFSGGHFAFTTVNGLGAGQAGTITLNCPGEQQTGRFSVPLVIDIDRQLGMDESMRSQTLTYSIDAPYITQGNVTVYPYSNIDLHGGQPDIAIAFDNALVALNGAKVQILPDLAISDLHYDLLGRVSGGTVTDMQPGTIIGIITSEGRRGWLRVIESRGSDLLLQYAIYARQ